MASRQSCLYETFELVIWGCSLQLLYRGSRGSASWLVPFLAEWAGIYRLPTGLLSAGLPSFAGRLLSRLLL